MRFKTNRIEQNKMKQNKIKLFQKFYLFFHQNLLTNKLVSLIKIIPDHKQVLNRVRLQKYQENLNLKQQQQRKMYRNFFKRHITSTISNVFKKSYNKKKLQPNILLGLTIGTFALLQTKNYLMIQDQQQSETKSLRQQIKQAYEADKQMKKILEVQICKSQQIKQEQVYAVKVKNHDGKDYTILIVRYNGKLYAVGGECTAKNQICEGDEEEPNTMQNAICFNDKLMCPHHGCAFDIKSGSLEYGPAYHNLPIFAVNQRLGVVKLSYPEKIPKRVNPKTVPRDFSDQRKVLILGQDHNATAGCIDGLRQYGFDGQISVVMQNIDYPYHKDMLHKSLVNLKLHQKYKKIPQNLDNQIQKLIQQKIYSKLYFHPQKWYEQHGIEFVYNNQPYRIIHKRFYPYVTFFDGTKKQYDGLVIATDVVPLPYNLQGINANESGKPLLMDNVFLPFRNKAQHLKLLKFLNKHTIKTIIVFGLDNRTLEFLQTLRKQFPDVKVEVIDVERENKLLQIYGEELTMKILKEYTQKNMEFYLKVDSQLKTSNKLQRNIEIDDVELKSKKHTDNEIRDSIQVKIGQGDNEVIIKGDCMIMFPSKYQGNTFNIRKKGKYVDIDFTQENRIVTEPNTKTDTARIFSIGTVSQCQFFFSKSRLNSFNPNVAYEQGLTSALNLLALGVPFAYIPVEITEHFGKKLYHAGIQNYVNQMLVLGSIQKWDFMILYAKDQKIYSVAASQSRQRQLQIIREAFRLQCEPQFSSIVNNQWDIPKIYKLIKKINKSFCYRDEIHKIQEQPIKSNIIWVQRRKGAGFSNDKPQEDQSGLQVDQRGYVRQV